MRPVAFFLALVLGLGFLFFIGRILFLLWSVAAVAALFFFAFRGMRSFVARGRYGYPGYGYAHWRRPMSLEAPSFHEPLVPERERPMEWLAEERIIKIQ